MDLERYYWVQEINEQGEVVGPWQPAWLDKDGNWWPRTISGWVNDTDFRKMFSVHPSPILFPKEVVMFVPEITYGTEPSPSAMVIPIRLNPFPVLTTPIEFETLEWEMTLSEAAARDILDAVAVCYDEGKGPDEGLILTAIKSQHPHLVADYSWLPWPND